ncbi:MAG: hypothetical protein OXI17_03485 [Gammaproteobacteria bacterium]|nr:hypothetical protein [Gammaproteobacteria bacterium]
MRLFSYKLTVDTGFAPNPFGATLTLATCKPGIRKSKRKGDWIAGFTSKELNCDAVGSERLIYLMKVGEKLLFREYFNDERFQDKIPNMNAKGALAKAGDNIYAPLPAHRINALDAAHFEQKRNPNHFQFNQRGDISGKYVLIADEFYYFGRNALELPDHLRPKIPRGQHRYGYRTHDMERVNRLIEYMRDKFRTGCNGLPHKWQGDSAKGEPHETCSKPKRV